MLVTQTMLVMLVVDIVAKVTNDIGVVSCSGWCCQQQMVLVVKWQMLVSWQTINSVLMFVLRAKNVDDKVANDIDVASVRTT